MFYFMKKPEYFKISEVAKQSGIHNKKIYNFVKELELYGVTNFKKTPFGARMIEKEQIKLLVEYANLRDFIQKPKEAALILKNMDIFSELDDDYEWAKGLKQSIWRRF